MLPWDSEAAGCYADIRHQLATTGQPIGELDMMIAAHSLSAGAVPVTNNARHYQRIPAPGAGQLERRINDDLNLSRARKGAS